MIERFIQELLARGDVLEAQAIREVTRLYADLNLAELVALLRVASEQDSPLARVGYHDQLMQKWDAAAASLGQPPDVLAGMVKTAVASGIQGTADMFAASQQVSDAFTVPPVYQLQWCEHSETRLREYWGAEAERLRQEVSSAVREGLERGQLIDQIAGRIQDRCGVSRSRATLIARNELGNAASFAMMESQRLAGVASYIWRTAGDKRVRPEHVTRNGKEFRWDDPPSDGHPGQPIMCRCIARAVIPPAGIQPIPDF